MNIVIYINPHMAHHVQHAKLFRSGLIAHGLDADIISIGGQPQDCDLAVMWGARFTKVIEHQRMRGSDYLIMERGYFGDRTAYTSLGFNGLNGHAEDTGIVPGDRWLQHGIHIRPWRDYDGDYVLITGQVDGDASITQYDLSTFYQDIVRELRSIQPRPVVFRLHPLSSARSTPRNVGICGGTLEEALKDAHCVVTINSNTCVDAIVNGIPVVTLDKGAMAWDVTQHELENTINPLKFDRDGWLAKLSYRQWTDEEIAQGEAWEHLQRRYYENVA